MTLRSNLASPTTRWITISLLASSIAALIIMVISLLSIPAMAAGAGGLAAWLITLQLVSIAAVGVSIVAASKRSKDLG